MLEGKVGKYYGRHHRGKKTARVNATKPQVELLHRVLKQPSLRYPSHSRVFELVITYFNILDPSGDSRALTVDQMRKKFENQRRACAKKYPELFTERLSAGRRAGSAFVGSNEPLRSDDLCHLAGIADVFAEFVRDPAACLSSSAVAGTAMDEAPAADDDPAVTGMGATPSPCDAERGDAAQDAPTMPTNMPELLTVPELAMQRSPAFDLDLDRLKLDPAEALEGMYLFDSEAFFMTAEQVQEAAEEVLETLSSVMKW